jgi:hypothetical protein
MATRHHIEVEGRQLTISNLEKVYYPESGYTKGEVISFSIFAAWRDAHAALELLLITGNHDKRATLDQLRVDRVDEWVIGDILLRHIPSRIRAVTSSPGICIPALLCATES